MLFSLSCCQRWLFQYLCNQSLTNEKPPNGLSLIVSNPLNGSVNGKTIPSSLRRNTVPKIVGECCMHAIF